MANTAKRKVISLRKFHIEVEDYTYEQNDDERIINDLLEFTDKQLRTDSQFLSTFSTWSTIESQNIVSTPIYYGQMVGYHNHNFYEICYVLEDKVYHYINGNIFILQKGDILIMHPDTLHSLYPNPCATATNILITEKHMHSLSEKLLTFKRDNPISYVVNKKGFMILHNNSEEITNAIKEISKFPFRSLYNNPVLNFHLDTMFDHMISLMLVEERNGNVFNIVNGNSGQNRSTDEILRFIEENYAFVDAETVCRRFHYSRMQLYRLLKKTTGFSFIDYISSLRYQHAKKLLRSTNLSVKKIAETVGLEENYFYRFFQNFSGKTPKEFRAEKE